VLPSYPAEIAAFFERCTDGFTTDGLRIFFSDSMAELGMDLLAPPSRCTNLAVTNRTSGYTFRPGLTR
jgi:hypothetical protein